MEDIEAGDGCDVKEMIQQLFRQENDQFHFISHKIIQMIILRPQTQQTITQLDLAGSTQRDFFILSKFNIKTLILKDSKIKSINELQFLPYLQTLIKLDLSDNEIEYINVNIPKQLLQLNISNNKLNNLNNLIQFAQECENQNILINIQNNPVAHKYQNMLPDEQIVLSLCKNVNFVLTDDQIQEQVCSSDSSKSVKEYIDKLLQLNYTQDEFQLILDSLSQLIEQCDINNTDICNQLLRLQDFKFSIAARYNNAFNQFIKKIKYSELLLSLYFSYKITDFIPYNDLLNYFLKENAINNFQQVRKRIAKEFGERQESNEKIIALVVKYLRMGTEYQDEIRMLSYDILILTEQKYNNDDQTPSVEQQQMTIFRLVLFIYVFITPIIFYFEKSNPHLTFICQEQINGQTMKSILNQINDIFNTTSLLELINIYNTLPTTIYSMQSFYKSIYILFQQKEFANESFQLLHTMIERINPTHIPDYSKMIETQTKYSKIYQDSKQISVEQVPIYDPFLKQTSKCEILTKKENQQHLISYFKQILERSNETTVIGCVRKLLSNFQLAGEGQAVERAVTIIAQCVSEHLQKDKTSTIVLVGIILVINTQFTILTQQKKRINTFMEKDVFIQTITSAPDFSTQSYSESELKEVYDQIEANQLQNYTNLCAVFFQSNKLIIDSDQLVNYEFFEHLHNIRQEHLMQLTNSVPERYIYAEIERLHAEIRFLFNENINIFTYADSLQLIYIQPLILSLILIVLSQNNEKQVIKNVQKILHALMSKISNITRQTYKDCDKNIYVVFTEKQNKLIQQLMVILVSFNQLWTYLQYNKITDIQQLQQMYSNYRYVTIYKIINSIYIQMLCTTQTGLNDEYQQHILLYLSYFNSISHLIPLEPQQGKQLNLQAFLQDISDFSESGMQGLLTSGANVLTAVQQHQFTYSDYSQLQNSAFIETRMEAASRQLENTISRATRIQLRLKLSPFMIYSILYGFYRLLQSQMLRHCRNEKLFMKFLPELKKFMEPRFTRFDSGLKAEMRRLVASLNALQMSQNGFAASQSQANLLATPDLQQIQLMLILQILHQSINKISFKEYQELFQTFLGSTNAENQSEGNTSMESQTKSNVQALKSESSQASLNELTKTQLDTDIELTKITIPIVQKLINDVPQALIENSVLWGSKHYTIDFIFYYTSRKLIVGHKDLRPLARIILLLSDKQLQLSTLKPNNMKEKPLLHCYLIAIPQMFEFKTKYVIQKIDKNQQKLEIIQYIENQHQTNQNCVEDGKYPNDNEQNDPEMKLKKQQGVDLIAMISIINQLIDQRNYNKAAGLKIIYELSNAWQRQTDEQQSTINLHGHKDFAPRAITVKLLYQLTIFFCVCKRYPEFLRYHTILFANVDEYLAFIEQCGQYIIQELKNHQIAQFILQYLGLQLQQTHIDVLSR